VVTHEHRDHVAGIPVFQKSYGSVVYANEGTYETSKALNPVAASHRRTFLTGSVFQIGPLTIESFSIMHDAADPVAFRISDGQYSLGVVTDLGQVTNLVRERVVDLDALVLESNHDPLLLRESPYPWELKQRISGRTGHLSNENAGELLQHIHCQTRRDLRFVVAAHISENSNEPGLALEVLRDSWSQNQLRPAPDFVAADVYRPTRMYRLAQP
jgi:phosphoribosyl 1,2-cyclic phosphodiesterase